MPAAARRGGATARKLRRVQAHPLTLPPPRPLRGEAKLEAALQAFGIGVAGRITLDIGASTGGFTSVLLRAGAARVYAVDAGHGQLLGRLRQDPRVVNLEATNVAELDRRCIPETVDVVTIDVSYLSLSAAVTQLAAICFSTNADLVGLVKPMFELRLATAPRDGPLVQQAGQQAARGVAAAGWTVVGVRASPVTGAKGAAELLLHARRTA